MGQKKRFLLLLLLLFAIIICNYYYYYLRLLFAIIIIIFYFLSFFLFTLNDILGDGKVIPYSVSKEEEMVFNKELAELEEEEKREAGEVVGEMGEEKEEGSRMEEIIQYSYKTLNLIHFFTTGTDEVKCWTIRKVRVVFYFFLCFFLTLFSFFVFFLCFLFPSFLLFLGGYCSWRCRANSLRS